MSRCWTTWWFKFKLWTRRFLKFSPVHAALANVIRTQCHFASLPKCNKACQSHLVYKKWDQLIRSVYFEPQTCLCAKSCLCAKLCVKCATVNSVIQKLIFYRSTSTFHTSPAIHHLRMLLPDYLLHIRTNIVEIAIFLKQCVGIPRVTWPHFACCPSTKCMSFKMVSNSGMYIVVLISNALQCIHFDAFNTANIPTYPS